MSKFCLLLWLCQLIGIAVSLGLPERPENDTRTSDRSLRKRVNTHIVEPASPVYADGVTTDGATVYTVNVIIAGETFACIFDTGSWRLWVLSKALDAKFYEGYTRYTIPPGAPCEPEQVRYGYDDPLIVNYLSVPDTATLAKVDASLEIAAATSVRRSGSPWKIPGVTGLIGMNRVGRSWLSLASKKDEDVACFAVDLGRRGKNTITFSSEEDLDDFTTQPISWFPIVSDLKTWVIDAGSDGQVLFDTGTTGIYLRPSVRKKYLNPMPDTATLEGGRWFIPCNTNLPKFSFDFDGKPLNIPGSQLMGRSKPGSKGICFTFIFETAEDKYNIAGLKFIENFLVIFDSSKPQIGVAERA